MILGFGSRVCQELGFCLLPFCKKKKTTNTHEGHQISRNNTHQENIIKGQIVRAIVGKKMTAVNGFQMSTKTQNGNQNYEKATYLCIYPEICQSIRA